MLGRYTRILSLGAVFLGTVAVSTPSQAMPAFARQTGKACSACHFQHYPALNDFGMAFKAGGYTDRGKQGIVKGKDLSLPEVLNASLFTKIRYQKTDGKDGNTSAGGEAKSTHSGEWQFPDEFALLFGGRVSENTGFMLEGQLASSTAPFLAGFKMPFMFKAGGTMKYGVVPFTTDVLGVGYGFELLNTGAVRNVRISEHRAETSAQQYVMHQSTGPNLLKSDGTNETDPVTGANVRNTAGAATGAAFVLWSPQFFVNYSPWTPNHLPGAGSQLGGLKSGYLRAAWTPTVGDWALGVGVQSWTGSNVRYNDGANVVNVDTKGNALDFQAQGIVGSLPLGVYLTYAKAPGSTVGCNNSTVPCNLFNSNTNPRKATTILGELGVIPNKVTLQLGYRKADNGSTSAADGGKDDAWTYGATYQLTQNVQLQLAHSTRSDKADGTGRNGPTCTTGACAANPTTGGSALTTFMLSAGF